MKKIVYILGTIIVLGFCYFYVNLIFFDSWTRYSAEKDIVFKDQPYSEYEYNVTPAPAPWTDDKEYKVWGETDLQKKDSYYKYLLESEPYRK